MALNKETIKEDPREKVKALRAEFAQRALAAADAQAASAGAAQTKASLAAWE